MPHKRSKSQNKKEGVEDDTKQPKFSVPDLERVLCEVQANNFSKSREVMKFYLATGWSLKVASKKSGGTHSTYVHEATKQSTTISAKITKPQWTKKRAFIAWMKTGIHK
jgi:predicted RNA binding protein YcfA (HicA-like mRNA interferase family)